MQYEQSRERSADFLRQAIANMGKQDSGFDPASFTLWYEHAAGINPALSQVLEQRLNAQLPLTNADVARLYAKHVASRDSQIIQNIQQRLLELMRETTQVINETGSHAADFGKSLDSHATRLKQPDTSARVQSIIDDLLRETQQMVHTNSMLSRQLEGRTQEVQQLTERVARVEAEASIDSLTGLSNRRGFEQTAADLMELESKLKSVALLLVDVDEFKKVNDSFGHHVGDQVLRGVAQVIRARIKGSDFAARLGGDEFAVLLPDTTPTGALILAEQIRVALSKARLRRVQGDESVANVTVSIGVAHSQEGATLEALLKSADIALYKAKHLGRNQVCPGATA
jgi:diguanylate cyclase